MRSFLPSGPVPDAFLAAVWSPDGKEIAYAKGTSGVIHKKAIDRDTAEVRVAAVAGLHGVSDWSPDGKSLLATVTVQSGTDVMRYDFKTESVRPLLTGPASEAHARSFTGWPMDRLPG